MRHDPFALPPSTPQVTTSADYPPASRRRVSFAVAARVMLPAYAILGVSRDVASLGARWHDRSPWISALVTLGVTLAVAVVCAIFACGFFRTFNTRFIAYIVAIAVIEAGADWVLSAEFFGDGWWGVGAVGLWLIAQAPERRRRASTMDS